jgi:hypothetical protein
MFMEAIEEYNFNFTGQVLFYGLYFKRFTGVYPRLVVAAPQSFQGLTELIQAFRLPIHTLIVDGDRCIYH